MYAARGRPVWSDRLRTDPKEGYRRITRHSELAEVFELESISADSAMSRAWKSVQRNHSVVVDYLTPTRVNRPAEDAIERMNDVEAVHNLGGCV